MCAQADDEHALALLECPQVKHWSQTRMLSIEGDASGVTGVHLKPRGEEEAQSLPVEGVFIYVAGSQPATEFLEGCVALKEDGGVKVRSQREASGLATLRPAKSLVAFPSRRWTTKWRLRCLASSQSATSGTRPSSRWSLLPRTAASLQWRSTGTSRAVRTCASTGFTSKMSKREPRSPPQAVCRGDVSLCRGFARLVLCVCEL